MSSQSQNKDVPYNTCATSYFFRSSRASLSVLLAGSPTVCGTYHVAGLASGALQRGCAVGCVMKGALSLFDS